MRPRFEGWRRTCRSLILRYKLWQLVCREHADFLKARGEPEMAEDCFHKEFPFDEAGQIAPVRLPEPPKPAKQMSMKDYLNAVPKQGILKSIEKVTEQLKSPVKQVRAPEPAAEPVKPTEAAAPPKKLTLLERVGDRAQLRTVLQIRLKEQEAKARQARQDPLLMKRISVLEDLQLRSLAVICSEYQRRSSMELQALFARLSFSLHTPKGELPTTSPTASRPVRLGRGPAPGAGPRALRPGRGGLQEVPEGQEERLRGAAQAGRGRSSEDSAGRRLSHSPRLSPHSHTDCTNSE